MKAWKNNAIIIFGTIPYLMYTKYKIWRVAHYAFARCYVIINKKKIFYGPTVSLNLETKQINIK